MIEYLLQPNVTTGIPRQLIFLLLMIAFGRYAFPRQKIATAFLGAGMFWIVFASFGRSIWWDLFVGFGFGNGSNFIWNTIGMVGGLLALKGFHLLLPPHERPNYNLLTVAFYPRRIWRRMHGEDEG